VGGALSTLGTAVSGALLQPPPGKNATQELATLRARWTQETAAQWDIDPGVMEDLVKAHLYGLPDGKLPPLPGVKSSDLDSMAKDYAGRGRDPSGQPLPGAMGALAKQDYLFETAAQLGVSEQDLATRIRLRTLPMADQTPASQGRSNALDILSQGKAVPFVNPDGSPMGDPKQWQEWDNALTASKDRAHYRTTTSGGVYIQGFGNYSKDDLNQINKAKLEANANRFRQVLQSPNKDDYERWFGAGSGMTDEQWTKYQAGTLDGMWSDAPSPAEAQRRNGILRISQALTKPEQINWSAANNPKKITYDFTGANGYQYRNATLDQYLRYIRSVQSPAWKYVGQDLDAEPAP